MTNKTYIISFFFFFYSCCYIHGVYRSPTFDESFVNTQLANNQYYSDVASVNVLSKEFDDLPPEVQHEILLERQQIEKYSYHDPDTLPQVRVHCTYTCTPVHV